METKKDMRSRRRLFPETKVAACWYIKILQYVHYCTGPLIMRASGPGLTRFNLVFRNHQAFVYATVSYILFTGNQAKYLIPYLFVILGPYYSEDRVFAWVASLVFAWIIPQPCRRYDYCTFTRSYTGTAYVS